MSYTELTHSNDLFYKVVRRGWKKLTIIPNVIGASVRLMTNTRTVTGNSIWVSPGTMVQYAVQAPSYGSVSDTVQVNDDMIITVNLVEPDMLRICGTYNCGTSPL